VLRLTISMKFLKGPYVPFRRQTVAVQVPLSVRLVAPATAPTRLGKTLNEQHLGSILPLILKINGLADIVQFD